MKGVLTFGLARSKYVGFVAKLDAEGRLVWQRTYPLGKPSLWAAETELATARLVALPLAGDAYAQAGTSFSEETRKDFYLLKLAPGAGQARAGEEDEGIRLKQEVSDPGLSPRRLRLPSLKPLDQRPSGAVPKAVQGDVRRIA